MRPYCLMMVLICWPHPLAIGSADLTQDLLEAARLGKNDVIQALLSRGANVDVRSLIGETALMQAAEKGHVEVVETLLGRHADVNAQDKLGWTAVMRAATEGHSKVLEQLLVAGASPGLKNRN